MEELGPLLLLNDSIVTALPNKVGEVCVFKCCTEYEANKLLSLCALVSSGRV